jgi:HEAT repeat protein
MALRVVPLLDSPSAVVRESAVRIAGYFGYPSAAARVLECCRDDAEAVRRAAVEHLPIFDGDGVAAALAQALDSDTPPVRAAAASAAGRIDAANARDLLRRALRDADAWVRYFALRSIGRLNDPAFVNAVLDRLERDPAVHVRLAAIDAVAGFGVPQALDTLAPLTAAAEPDVARAAIHALGRSADTRASSVLFPLLRAEEVWRRVAAANAVGAREDEGSAAALEWVAAADRAAEVNSAAVSALAALASREGTQAVAATDSLLALTAESRQRARAIAALARLPRRRTADVARGLQRTSPQVRRATVEALSGMRNPEATCAIETALGDPDARVRAAAVTELRRLGSRRAAGKLLALARRDPDVDVRRVAMLAMTQQPGASAAPVEGDNH